MESQYSTEAQAGDTYLQFHTLSTVGLLTMLQFWGHHTPRADAKYNVDKIRVKWCVNRVLEVACAGGAFPVADDAEQLLFYVHPDCTVLLADLEASCEKHLRALAAKVCSDDGVASSGKVHLAKLMGRLYAVAKCPSRHK